MSLKGHRSVMFEAQVNTNCAVIEDKCYSVSRANKKEVARSRCRARSRSWSRFRSRRAKSQESRASSEQNLGPSLKRDLSLVSLVRTASRTSVRSLVKLFETRMNEGRKTQIVLLDERRLDIIIQLKLYSNELLDLVASHFKLKEKQYFGLGFFDDTNNFIWLQGDRRVLDHEFPKKTGLLILHFSIRFYVDTIGLLRDSQTVELFYLNARLGIFRGLIECDAEIIFELAAHVLQETNGDFVSNEETREDLKKLPVIPTNTLKKHPSIAYCEDRVISYYTKLTGTSRGLAIVNYMNIIEKLPTYGIHYYSVKDKKDIPWWLGISPKGIAVYDMNDKTTPRKIFTWKNLENLYYRDRKFSIEVHGPKRITYTLSSFNPYEDAVREPAEYQDDLSTAISEPTTQVSVSRRTFGASNVDVHAWFASTAQLTKSIWSMAVVQHQFYLDRKQSKGQLLSARSMSEIASDLCSSSTSLPGSTGSDISRSPSSHSLPSLSNSRYDLSIEQSDSIRAEREMYQALKARKDALEETLKKKLEELKHLCLQEGELTGELPKETPLVYGEPAPVFRRRIGTAFSLSVKNVEESKNLSSDLSKLELEVDLQGKITSAAQILAHDKTVSKYVRKQRKQSYVKAVAKLKEMEKKLAEMHKQAGKGSTSSSHHYAGRVSSDDKETVSVNKITTKQGLQTEMFEEPMSKITISPSHSSPQLYSSQGASHRQLSGQGTKGMKTAHQSESSSRPLHPSHSKQDSSNESGFSSSTNLYGICSQKTSHYESADQLKSPATSEPGYILSSSDSTPAPSQHRSVNEPFLRVATNSSGTYLHYGSLDRKRQNYRQEVLRDLSPIGYRSHSRSHTVPHKLESPDTAGFVESQVSPSHSCGERILPIRLAWEQPQQTPIPEDTPSKPGISYNPVHCYSPRMYESVPASRSYHDVDVTHIHTRDPHPDRGLLDAHHTSSQPVFHRTERCISPVKQYQQEVPYDKQYRSHTSSGFEVGPGSYHRPETFPSNPSIGQRIEIGSPGHSDWTTTPAPHGSVTHLPGFFPKTDKTSLGYVPLTHSEIHIPGHLPLQHSDSHSSGSRVGSPSSPLSPTGYATSTLVTVTRLQPHMETTKPYEISDFYRYSEKLRRQRIIDQYQRQLMGNDRTSRSSSPLSVESEGHSSHSGSASSSAATQSPSHHQPAPFSSRPPLHPYSRSASAPLHSMMHHPPSHSMPLHITQPQSPEGHTAPPSYNTRTLGPNYAMQSIKVHQVHTAAKHTVYQPLQPMLCNPVKNPPFKKP